MFFFSRCTYLFEMSTQSDKDKLKCFINFSPVEVQSCILFKRFVDATKNIEPKKARKTPNCNLTRDSSFCLLKTVPNAIENEEITRNKSRNKIEIPFPLLFTILYDLKLKFEQAVC